MSFFQFLKAWLPRYPALLAAILTTNVIGAYLSSQEIRAQTDPYCQSTVQEVIEIDGIREAAFRGDKNAQARYKALVAEKAKRLQDCRYRNWPQNQAIWLRLYDCDAKPGVLEAVLDRIVARGYNQVYVEYFYDGQVLLPVSQNRSPWPSAVRGPGLENIDLLAEAIQKGRERGLKVYAWLFTMNFGYTYGIRPDRQMALARQGNGATSLDLLNGETETDIKVAEGDVSKVFIDPYSPQARQDYLEIVRAALARRPDGVLFDYVRYPRQTGPASVVSRVQDLWIYSDASINTLYRRAFNQKGRELIRRYLVQGFISAADVDAVNKLYPNEGEPMWQGRAPNTAKAMAGLLQGDLWYLSVAHAVQGILDFLAIAVSPVQRQGIPAGVVFFPGANKPVGEGFDSRLQPWDRFPSWMEWHPMAYANCGVNNTSCILEEIQRVMSFAPPGTKVVPALAGNWGESIKNRPSLEVQMQAIRRAFPQITGVSHFAYSWQEPEADRDRKVCGR